jgi:hypothetical protein
MKYFIKLKNISMAEFINIWIINPSFLFLNQNLMAKIYFYKNKN